MGNLKKCLFVFAVLLMLCGCTSENKDEEKDGESLPEYSTELNDRQKEILAEMDLPQDYFDYLKKQLTQRKNDSTHRSRNPLNDITHSSSPFTKRDGDENEEANDLPF